MLASSVFFDFYGVILSVSSPRHSLQEIQNDFSHFRCDSPLHPSQIQIEIVETLKPKGLPLFHFRGATAYGFCDRSIQYSSGHCVRLKMKNGITAVQVSGEDDFALRELLFKIISSQVGWALEQRGWTRLHAACFASQGQVQCLYGDSGFGKSTLTAKAWLNGETVWSDEITWLSSDHRIHAWPVPIQLSATSLSLLRLEPSELPIFKKMLYPPKHQLALKERIGSPVEFSGLKSPYSPLALAWRIVMGRGLMQILELNLRLDMLTTIAAVLFSRLRFVRALLKRRDGERVRALSWAGQNTL